MKHRRGQPVTRREAKSAKLPRVPRTNRGDGQGVPEGRYPHLRTQEQILLPSQTLRQPTILQLSRAFTGKV